MKRFKQKALATAVAASALTLASTAGAVAINPNGHGEALIYPYYTARDGQETLITLVNTTNRAKALKVRFREARNSNDVLDFNLFLSPFDVWTAKVSQRLDRAYLQTADTSCTNPPKTNWINDGNGVFGMFMFPFDYEAVDGGAAQGGDRTLEGYLEVIEMASFTDQAGNDFANLFTAVKHNANGVAPCTSNNTLAQLALSGSRALAGPGSINRFGDDEPANAAPSLLLAPNGGLFGSATIISTSGASGGTSTGYSATAYTGFNRDARIERRQLGIPSFADHNSCVGMIETDEGGPALTAWNGIRTVANGNLTTTGSCTAGFAFVAGEFATPLAAAAAGNLSERLHARALAFIIPNMAASISGEYAFMGDGSIHGTDWVITMPGKHYFVNRPTVVSGMYHGHVPGVGAPATFTAMRPFSQMWDTTNRRSCDDVTATQYSREEHETSGGLLFSPLPPGGNALCFETNVISFGQQLNATAPSSVFRSQVARWVNPSAVPPSHYGTGWMTLDLTNGSNAQGLQQGAYAPAAPQYNNINLTRYTQTLSGGAVAGVGNPNAAGNIAFTRIPGLPVVGFKATTSKFQQGNATTPANNYTDSSNLVFRRVIVP